MDDSGSKHPEGKKNNKDPLVLLARYSEIGFILPAAVIVGYLIGLALDHWLHQHWLYLAGLIFGAIAGFVKMIRMALSSFDERK